MSVSTLAVISLIYAKGQDSTHPYSKFGNSQLEVIIIRIHSQFDTICLKYLNVDQQTMKKYANAYKNRSGLYK